MSDPYFTVFTPTFNRAHLLPATHESLKTQKFTDFEWLIVDDGSTDGTRELVESWLGTSQLDIRYIYQPNAGKPAAHNRGVQEARGTLFATLDSDDGLFPWSLSRLQEVWDSIPLNRREDFVGVSGLSQEENGKLRGTRFPTDVLDSDAMEIRFVHRVQGDKWGFNRTDVLREHPFVIPEGSKFVSEDLVWFQISQRYRTRFINEVLVSQTINDGGSHLSQLSHAVLSGRLGLHRYIIDEISWLPRRSPQHLLRSSLAYGRYSYDLGQGLATQVRQLRSTPARLAVLATSPAAAALSFRDKRSGIA